MSRFDPNNVYYVTIPGYYDAIHDGQVPRARIAKGAACHS